MILSAVTDDPSQVDKRIYFDAIRWEEVPPTPTPTFTPSPTPTSTPTPVTSTFEIQVDQSNQDAGLNPSYCRYSTTDNEIYIGQCANDQLITSGFHFKDVPIPQGAQILESFIEFTVDGPYDVPVLVRINGEDSANARTFSSTDRPSDRSQTGASATWDIPSSDRWELGMIRQSPSLNEIIKEIVTRRDWSAYNDMAFIFDTLSSATNQHRRVIGFDRIDLNYGYYGTEHAARLKVTFLGTPPPAITPSPAAVPPTPIPTPTPKPICPIDDLFDLFNSASLAQMNIPQATGTPTSNDLSLSTRLQQTVDMAEFAPLLYQVRDDWLAETEEGRHYILFFEEHMTEISLIYFFSIGSCISRVMRS